MGEGNSKKADMYFKLTALYSFMLNIVVGAAIFLFREGLSRVFTNQMELVPMVMDAYCIMVLVLLTHGMAMVQAGAVRGLGMLHTASWVVFFAFYFVSLPSAYLLAFPYRWGIMGLWFGVVIGSTVEVVLYFVFLRFFCNWKLIAIEISERMKTKQSPDISFKKGDCLREPMLGSKNSNQNYDMRTRIYTEEI